jgi:hypothetical protein
MVMLLFTFARSETPLPQAQASFDPDKQLQLKDVVAAATAGAPNTFYARFRLKKIKQDRRMERPEARGNADWVIVGDTPQRPEFSIKRWLGLFYRLRGSTNMIDQNMPFFVSPDDFAVPLTYQAGLRSVRKLWAKVAGDAEAARYGLHGLRVAGYVHSKRGNGEALTVAHGGWASSAHERYDRFSMPEITALATNLLEQGLQPTASLAAAVPLAVPPVLSPAQTQALGTPPLAPPPRAIPPGFVPARPPLSQPGPSGLQSPVPSSTRLPSRPPAAPRKGPPPPPPLTLANAKGRKALCPQCMWPRQACREHGGRGWEVTVLDVRAGAGAAQAYVQFAPGGKRWAPMWVLLGALLPL